jgi:hypothetical protein
MWKGLINSLEVIPLDDLRDHVEGDNCWCKPEMKDDVLCHHAMDGRYEYETGERKLN